MKRQNHWILPVSLACLLAWNLSGMEEAGIEGKPTGVQAEPSVSIPGLLKELDCNGIRIRIFNSGKGGVPPLPLNVRDRTVFTVSEGVSTPYFYPQSPSADGIELHAESDYRRLLHSDKISLTVKGLSPDTVYFYQVEGSKELHRFRTKPLAGTFKPFRFNVLGDTQGQYDLEGDMLLDKDRFEPLTEANFAENAAFNQAAEAMCLGPSPEFIIHLGDIVEDGRYSIEWTREMFAWLKHLITLAPVYPVMGNHENHSTRFFRYFRIPAQKGLSDAPPPAYYSFNWGDVHFIFLDSNLDWNTIYDIDGVPGNVPVSYDFEGNAWNCSASRIKGGLSYIFNDESEKRIAGNLSTEDMEKLRPLKGLSFDGGDKMLRRLLEGIGFDAGKSRLIRTASIRCETRNLTNGRVSISFSGDDLWRAQMEWLEKDLEGASGSRYIFVFSHHPLLKDGIPRWDFVEKLERHRVSACFSGNTHVYRHELRNGVHHFVSGGGSDLAWSPAPTSTPDFSRWTREGNGLLCLRYGQQYISVELAESSVRILGIGLDKRIFEETTLRCRMPSPTNRTVGAP